MRDLIINLADIAVLKFYFIDCLSDQIVSFPSSPELESCLLNLDHSHSMSTRWRLAPMILGLYLTNAEDKDLFMRRNKEYFVLGWF